MALLYNPQRLLHIIREASFRTIFVYHDGNWQVNEKNKPELLVLNKIEAKEHPDLEALNELMMLNTKLLEATTDEYAESAKKEYDIQYARWKKIHSGPFAKGLKGEKNFQYKKFVSVEERIKSYYSKYCINHFEALRDQIAIDHDIELEYDDGRNLFGPENDEVYFQVPFDGKVAFCTLKDNGVPEYYLDKNHALYSKIKDEVSKITQLALNEAYNSVQRDLQEWYDKQFG